MKKIASIFFFFTIPLFVSAHSAGFVRGIWFSESAPLQGRSLRIYAALQNQTAATQKGAVHFLADGARISAIPFTIPPQSIRSISTPFTPHHSGEIHISATIIPENPALFDGVTLPEKILTVHADTDADGIADEQDPDDDNDGISDIDEKAAGTNPKVPDAHPKKSPPPPTLKSFSHLLPPPIAATAKKATQHLSAASHTVYNTIDPKAQSMAQKLKRTAQKLQSSTDKTLSPPHTQKTNTSVDTQKSHSLTTAFQEKTKHLLTTPRAKQAAALGLLALSFSLQHWLWHIAIVAALMIIRALYRNRVSY